MKGYVTSSGYMGLVDGQWILFATESDYLEYLLTSLSSKDANYILDRIQLLETRNFKNPYPILTQCEYA